MLVKANVGYFCWRPHWAGGGGLRRGHCQGGGGGGLSCRGQGAHFLPPILTYITFTVIRFIMVFITKPAYISNPKKIIADSFFIDAIFDQAVLPGGPRWSSLRWWWSGKLVWRCPMWAMRSPKGSARWCKSCRECWCCDHVGENIGFWTIWLVMILMRWWLTSRTTGRCTRLKRGSRRSGQRLKVLTLDFFVLAAKIIQALDSKPGSCNQTFHQQNVICHG